MSSNSVVNRVNKVNPVTVLIVEFSLTRELLGRDPLRVFDAETDREFRNDYYYDSAGKVQRAWGRYKPGFFPIEAHGIRLIILE